ncbi:MAG TPA: NUDIX hydrolase [Candidatus Acidoferrales bacterium]|nr:NUDIX hydrolase [Candidatus Acidoferrales bacterium]
MTREYPDRPLVGVGGVVVEGERVLVVRRAHAPLAGEWSIPGGLLELGEKLREGCAREVLEETGLTVEVGEVLDVFDSIFPDAEGRTQYHYVLIDFLCRPTGGDLRAADDAADVRWCTSDELDTFGMKSITVGVLRKGILKSKAQSSIR